YSNIITPTALNHAMMEASLLEEARKLYGKAEERAMIGRLEETVRAFDPCISCSVHIVRL
ncbi:MAG: Ni/Fe hydrogenase subunit alpha, partial [Thermodesulfobacterium sp.]|nr:Ni/Fe hydrogenase subunit alpha [Thermodesulfobacterium sp.]